MTEKDTRGPRIFENARMHRVLGKMFPSLVNSFRLPLIDPAELNRIPDVAVENPLSFDVCSLNQANEFDKCPLQPVKTTERTFILGVLSMNLRNSPNAFSILIRFTAEYMIDCFICMI